MDELLSRRAGLDPRGSGFRVGFRVAVGAEPVS